MACGCTKRRKVEFVWTGDDGTQFVYDTEIQAKAKVLRKGGSYVTRPKATSTA